MDESVSAASEIGSLLYAGLTLASVLRCCTSLRGDDGPIAVPVTAQLVQTLCYNSPKAQMPGRLAPRRVKGSLPSH
jgi:hypothetical protein